MKMACRRSRADPDIANPLDYAKMAREYVNKYTGL